MAKITMMFAFYFFFASFTGVFKFLKWKSGRRVMGIAVNQQEGNTYEIQITDGSFSEPCTYTERKGKNENKIVLNTPTEFVLSPKTATVITFEEYEQLKKNLYLNPLSCVGCTALTAVLILIASSI